MSAKVRVGKVGLCGCLMGPHSDRLDLAVMTAMTVSLKLATECMGVDGEIPKVVSDHIGAGKDSFGRKIISIYDSLGEHP